MKAANPFENSVFVIGAGASQPYGFPIGSGLKEKILELEHYHPDEGRNNSNQAHTHFLSSLKKLKFGAVEVRQFCRDFAGTGAESIDEFLQHYAVDEHSYHRLGQLIIYYLISIEESEWAFRRSRSDWIEILVRFLMQKENKTSFLENPPFFISFNYDNYLKKKIEFNLKTQYRFPNFEFNNVLHVYGKTSGLNYSKAQGEVVNVSNFEEIEVESKNLSLIRDDNIDTNNLVIEVRRKINQAEKVFILGYSFNKFNNRILFENEKNFTSLTQEKKLISTGVLEDQLLKDRINLKHNGYSGPTMREPYTIHDGLNCRQLIDAYIPRSVF